MTVLETVAIAPMEARLIDALPTGPGWAYEPKWDGFRCIAYRDGEAVTLISKSGKPLGRYFPEIVAMLAGLAEARFVLDGELTIATGDSLSFAALQMRLHPAESRIRKLAAATPAQFILFDCLALGKTDLASTEFAARRATLERFHTKAGTDRLLLSPITRDVAQAERWLARGGSALDGVVAKRLDLAYRPGERAMAKVKQHRSAVVGQFEFSRSSFSRISVRCLWMPRSMTMSATKITAPTPITAHAVSVMPPSPAFYTAHAA
jgi:ATP-dependent DNA ligase